MRWRSHREADRISPALLGALVIAGVIALFYLGATKDLPFSGGYEARLQFASANQIAPNAPVRIAGVNVGQVESIETGAGDTATVVVELDDEALPLHTDATAKVRPRTFLEGAFFVDIQPGSPSAPELPDGGTVPLGQTETPVQLDQVLTTLQAPVRESLRSAVGELATALDGGGPPALNRTFPELDPLFSDTAVVAEALTGTERHDLSGAIASSSRVSAALARDRPRLGALVSNFSTVARALADRQRELGASIGGLDEVLGEAPATFDALLAATPEARSLVAALRPVLRRAPGVVNPAVPLAGELSKLLARKQLPTLVALAGPAVRSLAGAAPDAITTFAGLRAPAGCLLTNAVPTLRSSVEDGALTTGAPVYRELLYSLTGLASASRNFDGNGFNTRYYAGGDAQVVSTPLGNPLAPLFGLVDEPIVGSSPRKPASAPPLRPDVPCDENDPPSLSAETGPGGFLSTGSGVEFTEPEGSPAVERILRRIRKGSGG